MITCLTRQECARGIAANQAGQRSELCPYEEAWLDVGCYVA